MSVSNHFKIRNGTRSGKRLCSSCTYGMVVKGEAESQEVVRCTYIDEWLPLIVVDCSTFQNKNLPQLHELKAIAWTVRTDKSGQRIGFISPEERKKLKITTDDDYDDD